MKLFTVIDPMGTVLGYIDADVVPLRDQEHKRSFVLEAMPDGSAFEMREPVVKRSVFYWWEVPIEERGMPVRQCWFIVAESMAGEAWTLPGFIDIRHNLPGGKG